MRAELVAVGSELLLGENVDTNSAWISVRLAEVGVDVFRHATVGDNLERMAAALRESCARADVVLVTGGLGPTQDDLTRVAVARAAGVALERREELVAYLEQHFASSGRDMPPSNLRQADLPAGARVLDAVGTAAGFVLDVGVAGSSDAATIYCMPGVPSEMKLMMTRQVLPELIARGGLATTVSRLVRTAGVSEAVVAEACGPIVERLEAAGNPTIAFLASRGETRVRITGKAADREAALALTAPVVQEVLDVLGTGVVGVDDEGVEHAVGRQLRRLRMTLAVAESVSGGGLGARIVTVPGASEWFQGGLVTYATPAKAVLAGVDPGLLEAEGPVSEAVAAALAKAASERLDADVGLAVVGVAGPTEQGGEPVGTVCLGFVVPARGVVRTWSRRLPGRGRVVVQEWAASVALDFLRRQLAGLG